MEKRLLTGKKRMALLALLLPLGLILLPAFCGAAEPSAEEFMLEDIVVTATKTGETKLQETPLSITAMGEETLNNRNVSSISDLSQYVPNAEFIETSPAWSTAYIRGIGNKDGVVRNESGVAMYVDGIYMERGLSAGNSFYDVERIEVLRGPQGTLYGRNATGGAVNIITKKPTDQFEMSAGITLGNYSKRRFDGTVSGPIVEELVKARLTVSDSQADSYVDNLSGKDPDNENFTGIRGSVQIVPSESVDILLTGDYYTSDTDGYAFKNLGLPGSNAVANGYVPPSDFWAIKLNADQYIEIEDRGFAGHVTFDLPHDLTLRSISGLRTRDFDTFRDLDGNDSDDGTLLTGQSFDTFSQELQLDGQWEAFSFLLGGFYYRIEEEYDLVVDRDYIIPGLQSYGDTDLETEAYAFFGQIGYQVTDKLKINAALRYSLEEKYAVSVYVHSIPWQDIPVVPLTDDWDAVTPKLDVNYQMNDKLLLYASASRGFRSGLFAPANSYYPTSVEPEYVWSYETGMKSDWFERRLRANLAAFYSEYTDQQVNVLVEGVYQVVNASDSTIKGLELEMELVPSQQFRIDGAVSYLDAKFDKFVTEDALSNLEDLSGNTMPRCPEWKLSLGAQYMFSLAEYGFLTLRGDLSWTDDQYYSEFENPLVGQDAYTMINGLASFSTLFSRWRIELYGKNLMDEEVATFANVAGNAYDIRVQLAKPRTYGLNVVYEF